MGMEYITAKTIEKKNETPSSIDFEIVLERMEMKLKLARERFFSQMNSMRFQKHRGTQT